MRDQPPTAFLTLACPSSPFSLQNAKGIDLPAVSTGSAHILRHHHTATPLPSRRRIECYSLLAGAYINHARTQKVLICEIKSYLHCNQHKHCAFAYAAFVTSKNFTYAHPSTAMPISSCTRWILHSASVFCVFFFLVCLFDLPLKCVYVLESNGVHGGSQHCCFFCCSHGYARMTWHWHWHLILIRSALFAAA